MWPRDANADKFGRVNGMTDQFPSGFVSPFMFGQTEVAPDSPSWQNPQPHLQMPSHSLQGDIVGSRGGSVAQHYGQITPPDDTTPDFSKPQIAQSTESAQSIPNAKSERARNAANQRHAKARKARKDSGRSAETPDDDDDDDGVEDKRERYREKNRLAAAKCRAKKKVNTDDLEQSAREATARNTRLRAEERELRDLFSSLRDQALAHDPTQGCNCQAIHQYNRHKAQETARGVMTGFGIQSPSQRSLDSASPTVVTSSRTQSFSGAKPQSFNHPARSHSMVGSVGFMPSATSGDMMAPNFSTAGDGDGFPDYMQQPSDGQQGSYS